ncbi:hypothetical protein BRC76_08070 [Halobacteriales archaeon QH_8_67_36]|nr:MAG: hypothetical protein BRC76_08070 [Halobacteriales archaeon QH_8_67_36]
MLRAGRDRCVVCRLDRGWVAMTVALLLVVSVAGTGVASGLSGPTGGAERTGESLMTDRLDAATIDDATDRFDDMSPVKDALTAAAAGPVTAMHDATECGIYGGLYEMARAAGVGVELETDRVPVQPGVRAACDFFGINPWMSISEGTLLAAVAPGGVNSALAALESEGIPAADAGVVTEGSGLVVDGEPIDHPGVDPFWGTSEEYLGK